MINSNPIYDAYLAKISPSGNSLQYSTYLGGKGDELGTAIAVSSAGTAVVVGATGSTDFPLVTPYQSQCGPTCVPTASAGYGSAFITRFDTSGRIAYSSYFASNTQAFGVALDSGADIYLTGWTGSLTFPVVNALYPTPHPNGAGGSVQEAFISEFNPAGSALIFSTYLGGTQSQQGMGIKVDAAGEICVGGWTQSSDFPTVNAVQPTMPHFKGTGNNKNVFISKLGPSGTQLIYSTFLGGDDWAWANGIAVDQNGAAYVTGSTRSDYPTTPGSFKTTESCNGCGEAFVSKIQ